MLLNPAFMYAATWTFVLLLYSFRLSYLLDPLRPATIVLVIGTSLGFILGWIVESLPHYGRLANSNINYSLLADVTNSRSVGRRLSWIWTIFFLGISFEIAYFRGAPLPGLLGFGSPILYTDFGIPGLHGLLNSMFYTGCAVTFSRVLLGSGKRKSLLISASIGYPVLVMSRQVLISLLVQYVFIYFSLRRPSARVVLRTAIFAAAILLVFGYLGDARSGRDQIIALAVPTFAYPDWLPSAFIWVYIYVSTPLNNVNYNIDIAPNYLPLETAGTFIRSFAREHFLSSFGGSAQWGLVSDSFNVGSLLQSLLTDFGVGGAIVFTLLCGVVFSRLRRLSGSNPAIFFAVIVLLHGLALSFFANLLFHLVFMFEIFAIIWVVGRSHRH